MFDEALVNDFLEHAGAIRVYEKPLTLGEKTIAAIEVWRQIKGQ